MSLPIHKRYEIVFLALHPMGPKLSNGEIAKAVKCAEETVRYWKKRWSQIKDLSDQICTWRKRITTEKQYNMIVGLANRDENLNSYDIRDCLKRKEIEIIQSTIRIRLLE
jgi:transposase